MNRYRYLLRTYPDFGQYHEALEYLSKCKEKLAQEPMEDEESWWQRLTPSFLD